MGRSLGIVIPAYKSPEDALLAYLDELDEGLPAARLRVEFDGRLPEGLDDRLSERGVELGTSDERRGKGRAISDGFDALDTDVLGFVDADGSTPADSFADVLDAVDAGADLATGSRRHPDAEVPAHQGNVRRWLGSLFVGLARWTLSLELHDYQCGAKVLTREVWTAVHPHLTSTGFAWDVELLAFADALGFDVREVPIVWEDQPGSTVPPLATSWEMARALVRARGKARRLRAETARASGADAAGSNGS